jgi:hypothetical protein
MRSIGAHRFSTKLAGTACLFRGELVSCAFSMSSLSAFLSNCSLLLWTHGRKSTFLPITHNHPLLCEEITSVV